MARWPLVMAKTKKRAKPTDPTRLAGRVRLSLWLLVATLAGKEDKTSSRAGQALGTKRFSHDMSPLTAKPD